MVASKSRWVRYLDMGGPRYLGEKENGKYLHEYNPPKPWGIWTQILGVVARSEGRHDTVVMYDETGVTFGAFQWTFKSGRLQRLLEYFKTVPYLDFEKDRETNLFAKHCVTDDGRQIFEEYGFRIDGGKFVLTHSDRVLDPSNAQQRKAIVDTCMGRRLLAGPNAARDHALGLCDMFVGLGQQIDIQAAMVEYAKMEFKRSLDVKRKVLKSIGWTIRCLLPEATWGSPIPAIFFNLNQNSPAGSYKLFMNALAAAQKSGLVYLDGPENGYEMQGSVEDGEVVNGLLQMIWERLNRTAYADWGFRSKQYLESGGKNPPRIVNIRPAINEFYGVDLPYIK